MNQSIWTKCVLALLCTILLLSVSLFPLFCSKIEFTETTQNPESQRLTSTSIPELFRLLSRTSSPLVSPSSDSTNSKSTSNTHFVATWLRWNPEKYLVISQEPPDNHYEWNDEKQREEWREEIQSIQKESLLWANKIAYLNPFQSPIKNAYFISDTGIILHGFQNVVSWEWSSWDVHSLLSEENPLYWLHLSPYLPISTKFIRFVHQLLLRHTSARLLIIIDILPPFPAHVLSFLQYWNQPHRREQCRIVSTSKVIKQETITHHKWFWKGWCSEMWFNYMVDRRSDDQRWFAHLLRSWWV